MRQTASARDVITHKPHARPLFMRMMKIKWLYVMLLPGMAYFLVYKYLPMWGVMIAFTDYMPFQGMLGSPWVGFKHFNLFFSDPNFWMLFRNTFILAVYNLVFFFPLPILLAILLNEVRIELFKRVVQTLVYVPHFVSWVVVVGIVYVFFTPQGGVLNGLFSWFAGDEYNLLMDGSVFRGLITAEVIWKESGWGTIIFLAALAGVDPQLYEAARIDGAGRLRQMWHITLPSIRSTILILLILRLGNFLDTGFEQIFLSLNTMNREVGEVFDTYVYRVGILEGRFSYSTAVGLFKSVVGLILVVSSNYLARKSGEEGIF